MKYLFNSNSFSLSTGLLIIRLLVGGMLVYHGFEVFNEEIMKMYLSWKVFHGNVPLVYTGKVMELIAGLCVLTGLTFRLAAIILIGTFIYITFVVGKGRFWYEEQHPFLFFVFGVLFLFTGPGKYSLDFLISKKLN